MKLDLKPRIRHALILVPATLFAVGVGASASTAASGVPSGAAASSSPIMIGAIAGTTGAYAATGIEAIRGAQLAVSVLNKEGGILGRKVTLTWYNDGTSSTVAATEFKRLVSDGAIAIAGSPSTGPTTVAEADRYKIPDIGVIDDGGPTIYTQGINKPPAPWAWGFAMNNYAEGGLSAQYALKNCPGSKFALLHDTTTYGEGMAESAVAAYKAAGKSKDITVNEGITENWATGAVVDLTSTIAKVKATGAKCVDVWLSPQDTAAFVKQAHTQGDKFTVLSNDELYSTNTFAQLAGAQANGAITAAQKTLLYPTAATKTFTKQFDAMFHPPKGYSTTVSQENYDAIMILAHVIDKAKSTSPTAIQNGLNHVTNWHGALGTITMTASQHQAMTPKTMMLVTYDAKSGKWVPLK